MRTIIALLLVATAVNAIDVVPNLNLTAYLGRWYQMAIAPSAKLFEGNPYCAVANYSTRADGKVKVYNSQRDKSPTGPKDDINGYAYVPDASTPAKLKVHFDVAPVDADYWVVAIGPRNTTSAVCSPCYDWAVVSDPTKLSLFVLARDYDQYYRQYNATVYKFLDQAGFDHIWNKPIPTPQGSDCIYPPYPN
eukprot:TRINITY_DN17353_c0_g1_i1.p1 TRINITY_DN17353_c0_g1~~TRINITY_DN17353_c0_g1_i1.p1  ORF type:complete len:192 (+),score=44.15 TRINITY_DN17353_c0_g1_i1:25-600(+)